MKKYMHRAWDPAGEEFLYWLTSIVFDETGIDYNGAPDFNTLTGVVVIRVYVSSDANFMLLPIEDSATEQLNDFEAI
jgi:hypothetical protein